MKSYADGHLLIVDQSEPLDRRASVILRETDTPDHYEIARMTHGGINAYCRLLENGVEPTTTGDMVLRLTDSEITLWAFLF